MKSIVFRNAQAGIVIAIFVLTQGPVYEIRCQTPAHPLTKTQLMQRVNSLLPRDSAQFKVRDLASPLSAEQRVSRSQLQTIITDRKIIGYGDKVITADSARIPASVRAAAEGTFNLIPEVYVGQGDSQTEIVYSIYFTTLRSMQYNFDSRKFDGELGFILLDEKAGDVPSTLRDKVAVEVSSEKVDSLDPKSIDLSHLSLPSTRIHLRAGISALDSVPVKIITRFNPAGYLSFIAVNPALEIFAGDKTMQGLGVQQVPITVRLIGSGRNKTEMIDFQPTDGFVLGEVNGKEVRNKLELQYGKSDVVYLRSQGIGPAQLTASTATLDSNVLEFEYEKPWTFLLASLLGGLFGGLAKSLLRRKKGSFSFRPVIGGMLVGVIAAVAYYGLGLNLLQWSFEAAFNEIAIFGISAVGAYFGFSASPGKE